jgi:hypothetical protein
MKSYCHTWCDAVLSEVSLKSQQICTRLHGVTEIFSLKKQTVVVFRKDSCSWEQKLSGVSGGAVG